MCIRDRLTTDIDPNDVPFIYGDRTVEGFHHINGGIECAISRGLAYAPYADVIWCETSHPDMDEARQFADAIHDKFPGKLLAYNCSPSFNWRRNLSEAQIANFQKELGKMGYAFQFVTLAGFHTLNASMFELAVGYRESGMAASVSYTHLDVYKRQPRNCWASRRARFGPRCSSRTSWLRSRWTKSSGS